MQASPGACRIWSLTYHKRVKVSRDNQQHLDSLRRKDSLRGTETTEISVRLENYCASHFEGSANLLAASLVDGVCPSIPAPHRETGSWPTDLDVGISLVLGFEHRIDAGKPELGLPLAVRVLNVEIHGDTSHAP